jgi:proteasome beta subunit
MTIAGTVADAQRTVDILTANAQLYKLNMGRPMPINSAARLVANLFFSARYMPLATQVLIGGVDDSGPHVFSPRPLRQPNRGEMRCHWFGFSIAYGVLEDKFKEDMSVEELCQ